MRKCPNCGRMAERTEDWACQWCGYPLLSKFYKKILKTYQQLKGEKPPEPKLAPEPEPAPEPEVVVAPAPEAEPAPKPEVVAAPAPEVEPAPEPEVVAVPASEVEPAPEPEVVAAPAPEPEVVAKPKPGTTGLTVEELYSAYSDDEVAADAKLTNKTFTVTGVVDRITVNDVHNIYYIILASVEKKGQWNIRCTFDRKYGPQLKRLAAGQTATAQGKYNGYKVNILMEGCVLVS